MLLAYLKRQYKLLLLLAGTVCIFAAVFALYDLPLEAVLYAGALCLALGLVLFAVGYSRFLRRHRELQRLLRQAGEKALPLPPARGLLEEDYQTLLQAVRKFAKMFILKKITLDFQETGKTVLTDEKWLLFVVEQVLSNALKYTPAGGTIRIYGDGATVVIADNGIGIREEDQARVFEKGFTGYNGRADKKSTGIGLYLCRQVMDRLNHGISLTSRPGQGTLVRLDLSREWRMVE